MIVEAVVLLGAVLILLAAIGVVRFDDVLTRMHALTKASTLGVLLVLVGAALYLRNPNDYTSLALAAGLQLLTSPVSAHLIGRATYRAGGIGHRLDVVDELAASGVDRAGDGDGDAAEGGR
jgi:multicomponent Na+:H+ antiporter subunit G